MQLEIVTLLVSRVRRYEGRPADGPAPYEPADELVDSVQVRAHRGLVGDRYFGTRFAYAAMTLIAAEKVELLEAELGSGPFDPVLSRRNVVTRGLDVDALARTTFTIDSGQGPIRFRSITPANPCAWLDTAWAPGAHRAMRGHAGIRCEPLDDGELRTGPATITEVAALAPDELRRIVSAAPTT